MIGVGRAGPRLDPSAGRDSTGPAPEVVPSPSTRRGTPVPDERDAWAILASVAGLGPLTFAELVVRFGSARAVVESARGPGAAARFTSLRSAAEPGRQLLGADLLDRLLEAVAGGEALLAQMRQLGLEALTLEDERYPARLRSIELPPPVLFLRGDPAALSPAHAVAVVGTRRPSDAGRRVAARISTALAHVGAVVVSGLAVGIDGAAHAAAVAEAGRTVAVLGGGHGRVFPRAHARLADEIVARAGAVVSELAPEMEPTRWTFPRRNRVISGLADATVVVEAGARSGALITADWALEQGRECFLVPGGLDAPASSGCLAFLRTYGGVARIVAGVPELLEDLGLTGDGADRASTGRRAGPRRQGSPIAVLAELGVTERLVAEALITGRATVDELVAACDLPVASVLGVLTLLEMRGLVIGAYGRYQPAGRLAGVEPRSVRRRRGAAGGTPTVDPRAGDDPAAVAPPGDGVLP